MPAPVAGAPLSGQAVKWNYFTTRDLLSVDYRMVGVCLWSQISRQKSPTVSGRGPWLAMYSFSRLYPCVVCA